MDKPIQDHITESRQPADMEAAIMLDAAQNRKTRTAEPCRERGKQLTWFPILNKFWISVGSESRSTSAHLGWARMLCLSADTYRQSDGRGDVTQCTTPEPIPV